MKKQLFALLSLLVLTSLALAACGGGVAPAPTQAPAAAQPTKAPAAGDKPLAGKKVSVFGVAADEQARLFQKEFDAFTERTGINVEYEGNKDFETLVLVRIEGGNAPDIAQFAQPGLVADFVKKGKVIDLYSWMDKAYLQKQFKQGYLDMGTANGKLSGIWHNVDVKSLVWYPKAAFDAKGYKIPQTWDEMIALSDQIVKDGGTPWCIGIESAGATGWVGTDWIEDIMLRTTTPENYDKWTRGELKFSSPEVKNAFDIMSKVWFNPKYVYGGTPTILTTGFGDAPKPLFENPPKCWLHRQASFIKNFFPKDAAYGKDYAYFYLPPIDPKYGKPVLTSGSISVMFNDRPEVREVMKFLATGESMKVEAQAGVGLAPHNDADLAWYPDEGTRGFAKILADATVARFDGSDLMPGAVGAGSFWKGIVDYVQDPKKLDTILTNIDNSWPK